MERFSSRRSRLTFVPLVVFFVIFSGLPMASATLPGSTYNGADGVLDGGTTANPTDPIKGAPDDSTYVNNTKEDDQNPAFINDSIPPNKTDFTNAYFKFDGTFLYAAWKRTGDNGSATVDFEFNQSNTLVNGTPVRTAGDVLVQYDFGGNTNSGVQVYISRWITSGPDSQCEANSSDVPCWSDKVLLAAPIAEASISADREFGELVINTALLSQQLGICISGNQVFVKSRASGSSFDSTLQDVIRPTSFPIDTCGSITAHKFHDRDADGTDDGAGEEGLEDWTMTLWKETGGAAGLQQTAPNQDQNKGSLDTDASGNALFNNLLPGTYYVCETLKANWYNSKPGGGSLCSGAITIVANADETFTFGNYQKGSIAGQKFHDKDADGTKDAGDDGLSGWSITLYKERGGAGFDPATDTAATNSDLVSGTITNPATTDGSGNYMFDNLKPGTYYVCETQQATWHQSYPTSGPTCTGSTVGHSEVLESQEAATGKDFGNYHKVSISGQKFHDRDADGTKDAGDAGVNGFTINLYRDANDNGVIDDPAESTPVATTTTAQISGVDGLYSFADLAPGSYIVCEEQESTWHQSAPSSGPDCPDGTEGWLIDDLLSGSAAAQNKDFGNYHKVSLSGIKWEDMNSDGDRDSGDDPLESWTIRLYVDSNGDGNLDAGEPEHADSPKQTAATTGAYSYTGLEPGDYIVCEEVEEDWTQSFPSALGNDVGCPDGVKGYAVSLLSGDNEATGLNFGNWEPGFIEGYKFHDRNANHEWDGTEEGLEGWTIWLDVNDNEVFDPGVDLSDVTDADGYYKIEGIRPRDAAYRLYEVIPTGGLPWYCSFPWDGVTADPFGFTGISTTCYHDVEIESGDEEGDYNFGNWTPAEKTGVKFEDLDADGVLDQGEGSPSVSFTIYADYNDNGVLDAGEPSASTDTDDGSYELEGINPGTWKIREVGKAGWICSYPTTTDQHGCYHEETFGSGDVVPNNNFGNYRNTSLSGTKYEDLNADGTVDEGEDGLEDWVIFLDENDNGELDAGEDSTTTDSNGDWSFTGLTPGTYVVCEQLQAGWNQSAPDPDCYEITTSSGQDVEDLNFLNYRDASLSGTKFEDDDADGTVDAGDVGLEGWVIFLDENDNQELDAGEDSTTTDSNGDWEIDGLKPGETYVVCEVIPAGWIQSAPLTVCHEVTPESGEVITDLDFLNYQNATLQGTKFEDDNADGDADEGDDGLEGWVIFLDENDNQELDAGEDSTTTDSNGDWEIDGLKPGETYVVCEVIPAGWIQSAPLTVCHEVTPGSGDVVTDLDFLNYQNASLSGTKREDMNADGDADEGDDGLEGWVIFLDENDNQELDAGEDSTTTDSNGDWEIDGLTPGETYVVCEQQQEDWHQSGPASVCYEVTPGSGDSVEDLDFLNYQDAALSGTKVHDRDADGSQGDGEDGLEGWIIFIDENDNQLFDDGEPFDTTDADGNWSISGLTPGQEYVVCEDMQDDWHQTAPDQVCYSVTPESGDSVEDLDFLNHMKVSIGGTKWHDHDADSTRDQGDEGLEGWTIELWQGDTLVATTTTDSDGSFLFEELMPGDYTVCEVQEPDWHQSSPVSGPTCESVGAEMGHSVVDLLSGDDPDVDNDFGNYQLVSVAGTKFHDHDADSTRDEGDEGLSGWVIALLQDDVIVSSTLTDENGNYSFEDLEPGTYTVCEVMQQDWQQSFPQSGAACTDSVGHTLTLTSGQSDEDNDFGNYQRGSIAGVKWEDLNANGVRNDNDDPVSQWTILLFEDVDGDGALGDADVLLSETTTDESGEYSFADLEPGMYVVCEGAQEDWEQTFPAEGPECDNGVGYSVTVGSGESHDETDFGNTFTFVLPDRIDKPEPEPEPEVLPRRILPFTGSQLANWIWLAMSMLAAGAALMILERRRAAENLIRDSYERSAER